MKNIYLFLALAFSVNAFSQIEFVFEDRQLKIVGDTTALELPLTIKFKENVFKNSRIVFISPADNAVLSEPTKIFGRDIQMGPQDGGFYKITLDVDDQGIVQADIGDGINIPPDAVVLKVLDKKFRLRYSIKKEKEDDNEEDYTAGYIYYDALALTAQGLTPRAKLEILESYGYKGTDDNPYLKALYDQLNLEDTVVTSLSGTSLLSNLGGTDVTYFAAGLARFLAERAKEELNEAFFRKMKEKLNAYPELKTAFPKTAAFLDIIETYSYASVIQVLKEAFETDIQNLPENLYNIKGLTEEDCDEIAICGKDKAAEKYNDEDKDGCKDYTKCRRRLTKLTEFFASQPGQWVALGMYSVKEGIQSTNPAELLKSIVASTEFDSLKVISKRNMEYGDYNVASGIELSDFISQSFISKDEKQVWVTSSQLSKLLKAKDGFKIYLGLLLQKELKGDVKIEFYDDTDTAVSFGTVLHDNYDHYTKFETLIKNTHAAYNAASNGVRKMIAAAENSTAVEPQALYDYYGTLTASLKPIAHDKFLNELIGKDIAVAYDKVEKVLTPAVDIAYHIATKKYSAAVYDASILLSTLNEIKTTSTDEKGNKKEEKYTDFKGVIKSFTKYGTLISTVAGAQSSDEVKQALEASVLPVGSSSIKRKSAWNISLNSYVGAFYGKAHSTVQDTIRINPTQLDTITRSVRYRTYGLYAPVGIAFSHGSRKEYGFGFSMFLQIIDVGALVNFYLTEGDETALPNNFKVTLADIISPGFQLGVNIPKSPFTVMAGAQYVPALKNSSQITTPQIDPVAWRVQVGIVVDIPLYNIKVWDFKE
jgi:hypothetical protein